MIAFLVLTGMANMNFKSMLRYSVGLEKSVHDQTLVAQNVSPDGRIFVKALLQRDAKDRPSATESLQHSWIRSTNDLSENIRTMEIQEYRNAEADTNVTSGQAYSPFISRPGALTAHSTGSLLPTAQWSTNQSQLGGEDFGSDDTAVSHSSQVVTASKSDSALPEVDSMRQNRASTTTVQVPARLWDTLLL